MLEPLPGALGWVVARVPFEVETAFRRGARRRLLCAFVPLFLFRELRRVLGEEKLYSLLCSRGVADQTH